MMRIIPALLAVALAGCSEAERAGPPTVRFGFDECAQCGMIVSDERFAAATRVSDGGRSAALFFDDVGCQLDHEMASPAAPVLGQWVQDHSARVWLDAGSAIYVHAPGLHTPMGSEIAAFGDPSAAEALRAAHEGRVLNRAELLEWRAARRRPTG